MDLATAAAGLARARFVVLYHQTPEGSQRSSHFDLMLETTAGPLRTWALEAWPEPPAEVEALQIDDHRPQYLEFQGPLSEGRGWVSRIERGTYAAALAADSLELRLEGESGVLRLILTPLGRNRWRAAFTAPAHS